MEKECSCSEEKRTRQFCFCYFNFSTQSLPYEESLNEKKICWTLGVQCVKQKDNFKSFPTYTLYIHVCVIIFINYWILITFYYYHYNRNWMSVYHLSPNPLNRQEERKQVWKRSFFASCSMLKQQQHQQQHQFSAVSILCFV